MGDWSSFRLPPRLPDAGWGLCSPHTPISHDVKTSFFLKLKNKNKKSSVFTFQELLIPWLCRLCMLYPTTEVFSLTGAD